MKIENVKVYDLEESIIASGYPMAYNLDNTQSEIINIGYWLEQDLPKMIKILNNSSGSINKYTYNKTLDCIEMTLANNEDPVLFDCEDLLNISKRKWTYNNKGYIITTQVNELTTHEIQRYIMLEELNNDQDLVVDHINHDTFDNRRINLRLVTKSQNSSNTTISKRNNSGVIGVYFSSNNNRWIASISINGNTKTRKFRNIEEAIKCRLEFENIYLGEYAPQKHLFKEYGIYIDENNNITNKKYQPLDEAIKHYKRVKILGASEKGSGHDQMLTGIRVAFDLTFSNKAWVELERYRFVEFVSSQSTMHRIAKFDLTKQYNEYVDKRIITIMEELKNIYNQTNNIEDYLKLLYSNPSGFELTARLTTNYRALKTVYSQRYNHRLPEWKKLCNWMLTLPYFIELTGVNNIHE